MTKYTLLIIGTLVILGGFTVLLLDPDLRAHLQQRVDAPGLTVLILLGSIVYSIYYSWFLRK